MPLQESTAYFSKRTDSGLGSLGSGGLGSLGALEESTALFSPRTDRGTRWRPMGGVMFPSLPSPMVLAVAGAAVIGLFLFLKRKR